MPQVCAVSTGRAEAASCCACAESLGQWPDTVCVARITVLKTFTKQDFMYDLAFIH